MENPYGYSLQETKRWLKKNIALIAQPLETVSFELVSMENRGAVRCLISTQKEHVTFEVALKKGRRL